ncbi:MAG: zinc ribbon domain-containing protein [Oscillospiraceae bacterium]|nr:zinc ribbon domain-containing protein [Oscillospiraceae bacterium]
MKYCKICGAQLADGSRFCTRCGFACEPAAEQPVTYYRPAQTEEEPPVYVAEEISSGEPRKRLLTAVLISLLVVGCMVALFFIRTAVLNQKGGSTLGDALGGNGREEEQEQRKEPEETEESQKPETATENYRLLLNSRSEAEGIRTEESYAYDERGNLFSYVKVSSDEYGWEKTSSYSYIYDNDERIICASMELGSDLFEGTYTWDGDRPVNCRVVGESGEEEVLICFETDANGNIVAVYYEYEDGSRWHVADAVYDEHGCMIVLTLYTDDDTVLTKKFDCEGRMIVYEKLKQGFHHMTVYDYYKNGNLRSEAYYEGGTQTYAMEYTYTDDPVPVPESVTILDGDSGVTIPFTVEGNTATAVIPGETDNSLILKLDGQGHTVGMTVSDNGELVSDSMQTYFEIPMKEGAAPRFLYDLLFLHVFAEYT